MDIIVDLGISNLKRLDGFHNEVYLGKYSDEQIIIRVSKSKRRNKEYILAEIQFLESLKETVNTIQPFYISGNSVFERDDLTITLFKFINGPKWNELEHDDEIIYQAGMQLALIHKTSSECDFLFKRDDYKEHNDIRLFLKNYADEEYLEEYSEVVSLIESITKRDDYFLIHGDFLFSNIIYNEGLTIIDFDDCEYGYYLYDIAVYMFYYLLGGNPLDMNIPLNIERINVFLKGYKSIREIGELKLHDLNPFFRLRQLKLIGTITEYQGENMGEWQKKFISSSLDRIKNKKDFFNKL